MDRRQFLRLGLHTAGSAGLLSTLGGMQRVLAASGPAARAAGDYRALVCIFLYGGNDSFNMVVPRDTAHYQTYSRSRSNLALSRLSLVPINPRTSDGALYGMHPASRELARLFQSGQAAIVANVGPLVEPVTRSDYLAKAAVLPPQLFSHNDQQMAWMTSYSNAGPGPGWAGRIADLMAEGSGNPSLALNVSLTGANVWQAGALTAPYSLGLFGAPVLRDFQNQGEAAERRRATFLKLLEQSGADPSLLAREYRTVHRRSLDAADVVNSALAQAGELEQVFPESELGRQLRMVARMIKAREALGVTRQMFFVSFGSWDTHGDQARLHNYLLERLSTAVDAFYKATEELGVAQQVTSFTATDFGRTLTSNGDGSDHGWGGHNLVVGGAVKGQDIYGTMPDLTLDGPDDAGFGRIIPTLSTDEYAATLARWFGVGESDLDLVFPNLKNFGRRDLGFLAV